MKLNVWPPALWAMAATVAIALWIGSGFLHPLLTKADVTEESKEMESAAALSEMEEIEESAAPARDTMRTEQKNVTDPLEERLMAMTEEEKVAQLFVITPEALAGERKVEGAGGAETDAGKGEQTVTIVDENLLARMETYPVGGIVFFGKNLEDPDQTKELLSQMQAKMMERLGVPLFLCVDEEGGRVTRIGKKKAFGVKQVPSMGKLAKQQDVSVIKDAGGTIGRYLKQLGFNVNFAPDADVLTNPVNTAIGDRSFGSDPHRVSVMAKAYAKGLNEQGVLAVYKHFPGHGGTEGDTHDGYAYTGKTLEELKQEELVPFAEGAAEGVDFIMAAHISAPNAQEEDLPASLSYAMLTQVLRRDLGYQGLIITDALNMGAVTAKYSSADAARKAFGAGADLLLMPVDFEEAYQAILSDVRRGVIGRERLDESVSRILLAKGKLQNVWESAGIHAAQ